MVHWHWCHMLLPTLVQIQESCTQPTRSSLGIGGLTPSWPAACRSFRHRRRLFAEQSLSLQEGLPIHLETWSTSMDETEWSPVHAIPRHPWPRTTPLATTHSGGYVSHHQIVHHHLPTPVRWRHLPLWRQTSFVTQKLLSMPLLSSSWNYLHRPFHLWTCQSRPFHNCRHTRLAADQTIWQVLPLGHRHPNQTIDGGTILGRYVRHILWTTPRSSNTRRNGTVHLRSASESEPTPNHISWGPLVPYQPVHLQHLGRQYWCWCHGSLMEWPHRPHFCTTFSSDH